MDMSINTCYIYIWKDLARWDVILMIFDSASIVTHIVCLNRRGSFLVDNYKIFRASLEWLLQYVNISIILAPKLTSHVCALLIDNTGNYLSLNNGSSKFEVDPHQFNLRLHHFPQFQRKKYFQKLAGLWLAGEIVVLGFMELRWTRVYRRPNVGLVFFVLCHNCDNRHVPSMLKTVANKYYIWYSW